MAGNIELIPFGGTLLMKDFGEGYVPYYTLEDVAKHGLAEGDSDEKALEKLGYFSKVKPLSYDPIDSINFNIDTHYEALRNAVLEAIKAGHVPVIAGGTDTLKFYGSLLAADLRQLEQHGEVRKLPPVIIVSSMKAFDEDKNHVFRLLSAARVAADEAWIQDRNGVFALVPHDEAVIKTSLLSLENPVDKFTGSKHIPRAFVGVDDTVINPETEKPGEALPNYDERRHPTQYSTTNLKFHHRVVAPPLENSNDAFSVAQYLHQVAEHHEQYPFDTVILKGPLKTGWRTDGIQVARQIARLREMGVDTIIVNDPRVDKQQTLVFHQSNPMFKGKRGYDANDPFDGMVQDGQAKNIPPLLASAGAIFAPGMTSAQAWAQALLEDEQGRPAYFQDARAKAEEAAKTFNAKEARNPGLSMDAYSQHRGAAKAMAIEYVPDAAAYDMALGVIEKNGTKNVVSVNCTDGAMAAVHKETLLNHPDLTVTCTFKYAGTTYPGQKEPEAATLSVYAPARTVAEAPNAKAGGETSPADLMKALSRSRTG